MKEKNKEFYLNVADECMVMFEAFKEKGFTEEQSITLTGHTIEYAVAQASAAELQRQRARRQKDRAAREARLRGE